jgi:hypothetical protein
MQQKKLNKQWKNGEIKYRYLKQWWLTSSRLTLYYPHVLRCSHT